MGDTRTSSVIQVSEGGESRILRTAGEEFGYRIGGGISPENSTKSPGTEKNEFQVSGAVPCENVELNTMSSVSATSPSYSGYPVQSHISPDPRITNSQDNKDEINSADHKSKKASGTESWSPTRSHKIHPSSETGNDNLAFDGTEALEGNEQVRGTGDHQTPEQKQWQFVELSEDEKVTGQVLNDYRTTDIPIVSGITKKHNFEKGFASNGVANGTVFPEHGNSTFSEISSKLETEEQQRDRKKQEKRDRNPLLYCKFVCSSPKAAFGGYFRLI